MDHVTEKQCTRCKQVRPLTDFYFNARSRDRLQYVCRSCKAEYRVRNGDELRRKAKLAYAPTLLGKCRWPGCHNFMKYRKANGFCPNCRTPRDRLAKYGLTPEDYYALLEAQGGRCAICRTDEAGGRYNEWHVDHDHDFTHVRGLLCQKCNNGIGLFDDSTDRMRAAIRYLERTQPRLKLLVI